MGSPETLTLPGAVDLHVHLREPGTNTAETIASGTRAALLGGYVLVADMPNNPGEPTWSKEAILTKHTIAEQTAYIPIGFYAGSQPDHDNIGQLADMAPHAIGLKLYGAPTTGNDNDYEADEFRNIVREWHSAAPEKPIMLHAGRSNLEDFIQLVTNEFGHHLHVCHVNDPSSVGLINDFKKLDFKLSSGVTPHHILKTSQNVITEGWFARMQPPLVRQNDVEKLFYQLAAGQIDVLETDHAPHSRDGKMKAERENPDGIHDPNHTTCFGVPGIELALPLLFYQAKRGNISMERIVDATSRRPAKILGVNISSDTIVSWEMQDWRVEDEENYVESSSGWTPYLGMLAVGAVKGLSVKGQVLIADFSTQDRAPSVVSSRGGLI